MNLPILNFNSGELSPQIDARSDIDKYRSGCRRMENLIPLIYGPATRRPGTKKIAENKYSNRKVRKVPFKFSETTAYMMEVGHLYIRFYLDGQRLEVGGVPVEVETTYVEDDLFELQFNQSADVVWITHSDYPQAKLSRTSATSFTLEDIVFTTGPFLTRNDIANDDDITITPSVTTGSGTLTASSSTFESGHVGSLWKLTQPRVAVVSSGESAGVAGVIGEASLAIEGTFKFSTNGSWAGTVEIQRREDGTNWETYRSFLSGDETSPRNVTFSGNEKIVGVVYRINLTTYTAGTLYADLTVDESTQSGIARVDSYVSPTVVNVTVLSDFASTDATIRWAEGVWSSVRGYPAAFAFFEERAAYGGTSNDPQGLWFSATDDFENFKEGLDNNDSFSRTIAAAAINSIVWISSLEHLAIGTIGGEWRVRATTYDTAITPTNVQIRQQTPYGSKRLAPIIANESILFVDSVGRKLREMTFVTDKDKFVAPDLSVLSEHITQSGITSLAYQLHPDSIVWFTLSDGSLISMTYDREQNVVAWSKYPLGGVDVSVDSVAVIPSGTEDEIWLSVSRTINGATKRYIEQMQPRYVANRNDYFFVDCGITYDGIPTTSIPGLDHLEGETVAILADGSVYSSAVVKNGAVTVNNLVSKAHVGLPYTYTLKTMKIAEVLQSGITSGSIKRISEIVVSLIDSLSVRYGKDENSLRNIDFRTTEPYGTPPALFSGEKVLSFDGGFNIEDDLIITGSDPLPATIRSIVLRAEKTGR